MAAGVPRVQAVWWAEQVNRPEETPCCLALKAFRSRKRAIAWCRLQHALRGGWYIVRFVQLERHQIHPEFWY